MMAISDRISRDELVQMYEFAVNQLTTAQEENNEIQYGFNIQAKAYINLMEENKRLQDAYNTLEFISKYDGKDNNRRSMYEEFIFIKVKAMDCIDRIKKSKSVPNGENDE
jgi:hypothetical protein